MAGWIRGLGIAVVCLACTSEPSVDTVGVGTEPAESPDAEPFAIVELFTSQGCNSCPPAESNLNRIVWAYADDPRVMPMAWHIDYWNYLGWEDPYSSERFSDRQTDYSVALETDHRYTPQMVVNGEVEFIGALRAVSDRQIAAFLELPSKVAISLRTEALSDDDVRIVYDASEGAASAELNVALVQSGLQNTPDSGENRGVLLEHDNVVRRWKRLPVGAGEVTLALPTDGPRRFEVVAWIQHPSTMRMTGASKLVVGEVQR